MPELLPDDVRDQLRTRLASLEGPVRLVHFTQRHACGRCAQQRELLEAIAGLSDKLTLEVHELVDDAPIAARFGVDKVPATAVVGDRDRGIRFYGLTGGYELGSLLEAIEHHLWERGRVERPAYALLPEGEGEGEAEGEAEGEGEANEGAA